jgi:hypothetical protein
MAQKREPSPPTSIRTTLGFLKTGQVVALESEGREMYLTVDGVKIARRALPKGVKTWISVAPGWMVIDTNGPLAIQIKHNGKLLDWTR